MPMMHGLPIDAVSAAVVDDAAPVVDDRPAERSRRRAEWMALAQHGDAAAYRALLDDLGPALVRFLRRRLKDSQDLADAYQDTFLALHRARHTYQPPRPIEPWLFAIARNVAVDYDRRAQRRRRHEVLTDSAPEPTPDPPPRDWRSELATAMRSLPNRQREALQLLKLQGLSIREAAARLGTTPTALKLRAHRAYLALKVSVRK